MLQKALGIVLLALLVSTAAGDAQFARASRPAGGCRPWHQTLDRYLAPAPPVWLVAQAGADKAKFSAERVAKLQAELAVHENRAYRRVRIAKIDEKKEFLEFSGIALMSDAEPLPKNEDFYPELKKLTEKIWPDVRDGTVGSAGTNQFGVSQVNLMQKLRERTLEDAAWQGMVFADAWYDKAGTLVVAGYRTGKDQATEVRKYLKAELTSEVPLLLKDASKDDTLSLDGLKEINLTATQQKLQKQFAAEEDLLFRQTHLKALAFRYIPKDAPPKKGAPLSLQLEVQAVVLQKVGSKGLLENVDNRLSMRVEKELQLDLPVLTDPGRPRPSFSVVLAKPAIQANPIPQFQQRVSERQLDGVLLHGARFDADGNLLIDVRVAEKNQEQALTELFAGTTDPAIPGYSGKARVASPPNVIDWPQKDQTWQGMRGQLQRFLAGDTLLARQTRIDRLSFNYQKDGSLVLQIHGVSLFKTTDEDKARKELETTVFTFLKGQYPAVLGNPLDKEMIAVVATSDFCKFQYADVKDLRQQIRDDSMDDFFVTRLVYNADGVLTPLGEGWVADGQTDQKQLDRLVELLRKRLEGKLLWSPPGDKKPVAPPEPGKQQPPISLEHITLVNPAAILRQMQLRFASSTAPLLRQTRLDGVRFGDGPGDDLHLRVNLTSIHASNPKATADLTSELQKDLALAFAVDKSPRAKGEPARGLMIKLADKVFQPSPLEAFQSLVPLDRPYDGMLFQDARFDEQGRLVVDVLRTAAPEQTQLRDRLIATPPAAVTTTLFQGQAPARAVIQLTPREPFDWVATLREVQAALGTAASPALQRTSLQRAYFTRVEAGPVLHLSGLYLPSKGSTATDLEALGKLWRDRLPKTLNPDFKVLGDQFVSPSKPLPTAFQTVVAQARELDGVRVDDVTFTPDGNLVLKGIWVANTQDARLRTLLQQALNEVGGPFAKLGVDMTKIEVVRSDILIGELRDWFARKTQREQVLLSRLYFDAEGNLQIPIEGTDAAEQAAIEAEKKQALDKLIEKYPLLRKKGISALPRPAEVLTVALVLQPTPVVSPPFTARRSLPLYMREQIALRPELDGLRLDRCYFDGGNVFILTGLASSPAQVDAVKTLVAKALELADFRESFPKGYRFDTFPTVPLQPLVRSFPQLLEADIVFGGVRVQRVYHSAARKVIVRGISTTPLSAPVQQHLVNLLKSDPHAREHLQQRTGTGMVTTVDPEFKFSVVGVDFAGGDRAYAQALTALVECANPQVAAGYLDGALFHAPTDATALYLRAICYLQLGDTLLAERDLRRLGVQVEMPVGGGPLTNSVDPARLERIQGAARIQAANLLVKLAAAPAANQDLDVRLQQLRTQLLARLR